MYGSPLLSAHSHSCFLHIYAYVIGPIGVRDNIEAFGGDPRKGTDPVHRKSSYP